MVQTVFGPKQYLVKKLEFNSFNSNNIWVKKLSKKLVGGKYLFGSKKILNPKRFWSNNILGPKKFKSKLFWSSQIAGSIQIFNYDTFWGKEHHLLCISQHFCINDVITCHNERCYGEKLLENITKKWITSLVLNILHFSEHSLIR